MVLSAPFDDNLPLTPDEHTYGLLLHHLRSVRSLNAFLFHHLRQLLLPLGCISSLPLYTKINTTIPNSDGRALELYFGTWVTVSSSVEVVPKMVEWM